MARYVCEVTWDNGNSAIDATPDYEFLYDFLYDRYHLCELTDIYSIFFNGYFCIIKEFDYNFDDKVFQLLRLCDYFESNKQFK